MIYIIEYPIGDKPPLAWAAPNEEACRQSIIATHDLEPHTGFKAALEANEDALHHQRIYNSTSEAAKALDDPRTWGDMDAYHALRSLVYKTLEIN